MILKPKPSSFKTHYAEDIAEHMAYANPISSKEIFKPKKELRKELLAQRKVSHAS